MDSSPADAPPHEAAQPALLADVDDDAVSARRPQRSRSTLAAMCIATFMIQVDVTIVNVALPRIQADLGLKPGDLVWVISAYALSLAALIPVGGALGDHYGRKRAFLVGMGLFALGSIACALSTGAVELIAARALQGAGGAAMLAMTLSIITETFPASTRAAAIGTWAAIGGTGFGVGPIAGGVLLSLFGWASVFWVNIPFAVVGVVLAGVAVRESRNPGSQKLDVIGALTSGTALVAVTYALVESSSHPWTAASVVLPLLVGVVLLTTFALWERRTHHPMLPPSLFRIRGFTCASIVYLMSYTAFSGVLFYVTLLFQNVDGWSALRTGLSWLFMNVPFLAAAQATGKVDRRLPPVVVVPAGCLAAAAGIFTLSAIGPTVPFAVAAVGYVVAGTGFGILVPVLTNVAMRDLPDGVSGAASAVVNSARQVGTSVGLAVLGAIGVAATTADWHHRVATFPASVKAAARSQAAHVAGARLDTLARQLGPVYRHPAARSFVHGYHLAVLVGACCLVAAAGLSTAGLARRRGMHGPLGARPGTGDLPSDRSTTSRSVDAG
jgi:EmrB/QacA subfamily drug resistance transporter